MNKSLILVMAGLVIGAGPVLAQTRTISPPQASPAQQAMSAALTSIQTSIIMFADEKQREIEGLQKKIDELTAKCGKACEPSPSTPSSPKPVAPQPGVTKR